MSRYACQQRDVREAPGGRVVLRVLREHAEARNPHDFPVQPRVLCAVLPKPCFVYGSLFLRFLFSAFK